jgi:hypothetical protein
MQRVSPIEKAMSDLLMTYIDMERRLRSMHRVTKNLGHGGAVLSGSFCNECFQNYPCDTIRKGIDNEQDD